MVHDVCSTKNNDDDLGQSRRNSERKRWLKKMMVIMTRSDFDGFRGSNKASKRQKK